MSLPTLPHGPNHPRYVVVGKFLEDCGHRHKYEDDAARCLKDIPGGRICQSFATTDEMILDELEGRPTR